MTLWKKIDDYLSQQKIEDNEQSFRELIKKDIDAWVDFETKRAVSIRLHNDEKQALANRFREKYTPSKTEKNIIKVKKFLNFLKIKRLQKH